MMSLLKKIALVSCFMPLILQTGCISLLPDSGPRPKQVFLNPSVTSAPLRDTKYHTVAVARPTAPTLLETNRLPIHYEDQSLQLIDHIGGVVLQDDLPSLVQRHIIKALIASKKFKAVGFMDDTFSREVILETDIEAFDIHYNSTKKEANISLLIKLLETKGRKVLWQHRIQMQSPIEGHNLKAFIKALKTSYEKVLYQITQEVK